MWLAVCQFIPSVCVCVCVCACVCVCVCVWVPIWSRLCHGMSWNNKEEITLHVSNDLSVHHQEFNTVHTASGICHTGTVAAC